MNALLNLYRDKKVLALIAFFIFLLACKPDAELPSRYDLQDYKRITSVKDQGHLATCGTFAAIGSIESNYMARKLDSAGNFSRDTRGNGVLLETSRACSRKRFEIYGQDKKIFRRSPQKNLLKITSVPWDYAMFIFYLEAFLDINYGTRSDNRQLWRKRQKIFTYFNAKEHIISHYALLAGWEANFSLEKGSLARQKFMGNRIFLDVLWIAFIWRRGLKNKRFKNSRR